jgi:hypothetical protein
VLSAVELDAADMLLQRCVDVGVLEEVATVEPLWEEEDRYLCVLRFLRARNFSVDKAFEKIYADWKWRNGVNRDWMAFTDAQAVLGCNPTTIYKLFPTWFQGFCKEGRPVTWKQFGKLDHGIFDVADVATLLKFHSWESDQLIKLGRKTGFEKGYNVETFVVIIDAEGWNLSHMSSNCMAFVRGMATADSSYFPERLGALHVINAPRVLSILWRAISPLLDAVTKSKIKISSAKDSWLPDLIALMGEDQIPVRYGGTAPNLSEREALDSIQPFVAKDGDTSSIRDDSLVSLDSEQKWGSSKVRETCAQTAAPNGLYPKGMSTSGASHDSQLSHADDDVFQWTIDGSTQTVEATPAPTSDTFSFMSLFTSGFSAKAVHEPIS